MSRDPLDVIWRLADSPDPLLIFEDLAGMPRETMTRLLELGVLRESTTATHVVCDACCDDHLEQVVPVKYPDGKTRFFIPCPQNGRVEVSCERLLQWRVDYLPLLDALASALSVTGRPSEIQPGRVWNLGRAALAGKSKLVWAARGLAWPDAEQIGAALPQGRSLVLFFLGLPAEDGLLGITRESIIELRTVIHLDGKLVADRYAIEAQLTDVAEAPAKKQAKKQSQRDATVGALKRELHMRILSMKSAVRNADRTGKPFALPRVTQKELARAIGASESSVCRAIRKSGDRELQIMLQAIEDPDMIRKYSS